MAATNQILPQDPVQEISKARALAGRYYHDFVDLKETRIDHELFHSIPVDLMFRYNFVPIQADNGTLEIAIADPRNLNLIDELAVLLGKKLRVRVATAAWANELSLMTPQIIARLNAGRQGRIRGIRWIAAGPGTRPSP